MRFSGNHKSLRAFTLLELLIGMVVSGIVLAATFSAYQIVRNNALRYRENAEQSVACSFFYSQFTSDFYRSGEIRRFSENEIIMQQSDRQLIYHFTENYVLRKDHEHADTFFVPVKNIQCFFRGESVTDETVADEIRMDILFDQEPEPVTFIQKTDSRALLKTETDKIR